MTGSKLFDTNWERTWLDWENTFDRLGKVWTHDYHEYSTPVSYTGEDKEDRLELSVDMPGVTKEDVKISFEGKVLRIKAEKGSRKYDQKYRIKADIDDTKISAKLENGVLTVTLPKSEGSKPTEIKVE